MRRRLTYVGAWSVVTAASPVAFGFGYSEVEALMTGDIPSTLKRPTAKLLARFRLDDIGDDTIRVFLTKGFSLAICCRDCPRMIEWTPADLDQRFGHILDLRIADLASRLSCTGDEGCGSQDIAVFPHAYDGRWAWPPEDPGE
jgi:hypothetical protein